MCFRPASAGVAVKPVECSCGETVFPTDGALPERCPYCEKSLEDAAAPGAPAAPAAPAAPGIRPPMA